MAQELVSQSGASMGALDETGDVGDHEGMRLVDSSNAQVRSQRRERIVSDLRTRGRNAGNERRLADVGEADQTHIGQQLQLQPQVALFARLSLLAKARSLVRRGGKAGIPSTTHA